MKRDLNKFIVLILIGCIALSLGSCLKNNKYYNNFTDYEASIELPLAASKANKPFAVSFDVADTPTTYYAVVNVASVEKLNAAVTATLGIDSAYLNQYNADQLAADPDYEPYELMPDSTYHIDSYEVTVPAGERQARVKIMISTSKMDASGNYVLPFTITKASIPVSSWNHLLMNIGAKNKYDGVYETTGTFNDYANAGWSGNYPKSTQLVTQGLRSVGYADVQAGGFGYVFSTGAALSQFGNFAPVFTFDDNGNVVSVSNYYDDPLPRNREARIDPAGINKYNFDTKTLEVSYFMIQSGADRGHMTEKLVYKKAR